MKRLIFWHSSKHFHASYFPLLTLGSGILMGFTTSPVEVWPLAWIALVPLWVLIIKNEKSSSFLSGLLWGIGYHGVALSWITGIHPMTWMGVPWLASLAIALFCWSFITLWGAALVAIWAACMGAILEFRFPILDWVWLAFKQKTLKPTSNLLIQNHAMFREESISPKIASKSRDVSGRINLPENRFKITRCFGKNQSPRKSLQNRYVRVPIGVALWCLCEYLWSLGPLWWTSLSYTQSPHNLAILHLGQISGPTAVTAAIVAVNGLIAEAWMESQKSKVKSQKNKLLFYLLPFAFCLILHLIGFGLYSRPLIQPSATALKVGIIQGNVANEIKLYPDGFRRAIEGYTSGYQTLAEQGVDAVLTPEGALPFLLTDVRRSSFYSAVLEKGVVAWLGAFGDRGRSITNSLFTVTSNGDIFSRYDKVKLVPLGEYIPFEQFLGGIVDRLSPLDAHMIAGAPTQLFETPFGRAIVGICYESVYSQHFRRQTAAGGQFILTASNNAHYSKTMPAQHHAQDVMRAIESDRWAVRATNTGYSGIVDPHGKTLWMSGINTYEIHAATIYRRQTQTLYVRWGDWLIWVLLIGGAIACSFPKSRN